MAEFIAYTREVSPSLASCELSHQPRVPIDVDRATAQHAAYEQALADAGCLVYRLPADASHPDCVFIEDTAVALDEIAVIMRPGAPARRGEIAAVEEALKSRRLLAHITDPGTMDGGDVLVLGRTIFVGSSGRTNAAGVEQLRTVMAHFGYQVQAVAVTGCLHLKSAVTAVRDDVVLINPASVAAEPFASFQRITVDPSEPAAANVLRLGTRIICAAAYPRTRERLERQGVHTLPVDVSEIAKAEGAVTCCSIILKDGQP